MHSELLRILRCPRTGEELRLERPEHRGGRIYSGWLVSANSEHRYPIRRFIPRFVPESNYADNFGLQWNKFSKTQLDSFSGHPISANRFWKATGWNPQEMAGQWVLDVGCGAGRFAEVALQTKARVVALDYSSAVDACYANLSDNENLDVVQGDLYSLPFVQESFRFVYSLGVLQHTPDVENAFAALPRMVAQNGGRICVDFYENTWKRRLLPRYWLRPITKRLPDRELLAILQSVVPKMLAISHFVGRIPVVGAYVKRLVPVVDHRGLLPLSDSQHLEWSLLDTFDWYSPEFDNPQAPETVARWLEDARLEEIEVVKAGHLVGRGRRRLASRD